MRRLLLTKERIATTAAAVVAFAAIAGCGGGGDSTSTAPSKDEFVQQAGAICNQAATDVQASIGQGLVVADPAAIKKYEEGVTAALEKELAAFQELQAPAGDEQQVAALVAELQKQVDTVKANPELLRIPKQAIALGKPFRTAAGEYGIADCQNPKAGATTG